MSRILSPVPRRRPSSTPRMRKRPQAAHDMVMRGIGLNIVSGIYPAGSLLPSKELLSRQFKVSNSTLREALQKLATKGMIMAKTRVGTRVLEERHWNMFDADILTWRFAAGVDRNFLAHLFALRQAFEPMAAAIMAERQDDEANRRLAALTSRMAEAGADREAFAHSDLALHLFILESTGNPFLQSISALIRAALSASFALSAPGADAAEAHLLSQREHGALAAAIAAGEPQAAAMAMMQVIRRGWSNVGGAKEQELATIQLVDFVP